jgi:hypothetical protein
MKTPISDHDYELRLGSHCETDIQKTLGATVISGTCMVAHDAATWMMSIFTGSPLLLSLMSTVAALPFFLFTLPAGSLAR